VKPELVLVVAVVLAIAIRVLWRELLGVIAIGCLTIVFIGILYLFAVTSPESLSGT
jgi:hypothetical protein